MNQAGQVFIIIVCINRFRLFFSVFVSPDSFNADIFGINAPSVFIKYFEVKIWNNNRILNPNDFA